MNGGSALFGLFAIFVLIGVSAALAVYLLVAIAFGLTVYGLVRLVTWVIG